MLEDWDGMDGTVRLRDGAIVCGRVWLMPGWVLVDCQSALVPPDRTVLSVFPADRVAALDITRPRLDPPPPR